jgi:hypothetical protein
MTPTNLFSREEHLVSVAHYLLSHISGTGMMYPVLNVSVIKNMKESQ